MSSCFHTIRRSSQCILVILGFLYLYHYVQLQTQGCEAILSATHVKKTRYVHQVNVAALHSVKREFWWFRTQRFWEMAWYTQKKSPRFEFWYTLLGLECLILMLVRSLRSGNFAMFVEVLDKFLSWTFPLNHTHYARPFPGYIQTLRKLPD